MNASIAPEKKTQAALAYALGWARGVLSDLLDGDFSQEQARRILMRQL